MDEDLKNLFEQARRQLLTNQPLRASSGDGCPCALALSAGEVGTLKLVCLNIDAWEEGAAHDPLMLSIADYMALIETSYTTSEAAKYLNVDPSRIRQRLRERSLYGIDYDGKKRLPRFQFERHQVIPGLREVIAVLPLGLNPPDVAEWFLSANADLEPSTETNPISPREWLLSGRDVSAVVAVARSFAN
jgi:hypothetical protein